MTVIMMEFHSFFPLSTISVSISHLIKRKILNTFSLKKTIMFTADPHLKLLHRNLQACKFLIPNTAISLQHLHFILNVYAF